MPIHSSFREQSKTTCQTKPRILCIVGPTLSGKSDLGIRLAKKFHGEIINADARQIYRGIRAGTGKPDGKWKTIDGVRAYMVQNIRHHLYDIIGPVEMMTVVEWRAKALKKIREIIKRCSLPIVVGGTGLYVQSLIDNYQVPAVPPQAAFRKAMDSKTLEELVTVLAKIDHDCLSTLDLHNRRRVLRALEVVTYTGKSFFAQRRLNPPVVDALLLGIRKSREDLYASIDHFVESMATGSWEAEIRDLRKKGVLWDAPAMTSIGYREIAAVMRGEQTLGEAMAHTRCATYQYSKRQMTWFKRDKRICWVKDAREAERLVFEWFSGTAVQS